MYKDKDKQREANRKIKAKSRAQGVTGQGVTSPQAESPVTPKHGCKYCGKTHPIDFEGRRRDYELLESWANGNGTEYQRRLGMTARDYRPLDFIVTSYLGR